MAMVTSWVMVWGLAGTPAEDWDSYYGMSCLTTECETRCQGSEHSSQHSAMRTGAWLWWARGLQPSPAPGVHKLDFVHLHSNNFTTTEFTTGPDPAGIASYHPESYPPALSEPRARGRPSESPEAAQAAPRAAAPSQPGTLCPRAAGAATPAQGPQLGGSGGAGSGGDRGSQQAAVCRGGRGAGGGRGGTQNGAALSAPLPPATLRPRGPAGRGANSLPGLAWGGGRAGSAAGGRRPAETGGARSAGCAAFPQQVAAGSRCRRRQSHCGPRTRRGRRRRRWPASPRAPPRRRTPLPLKVWGGLGGRAAPRGGGGAGANLSRIPLFAVGAESSRAAFILLIKKTDLGPAAPRRAAALLAPLVPFSSLLSSSSLPPAPWSLRRGREAGNPKALNWSTKVKWRRGGGGFVPLVCLFVPEEDFCINGAGFGIGVLWNVRAPFPPARLCLSLLVFII